MCAGLRVEAKLEFSQKCYHLFFILLATEMDFWRRSARKSRKEKVRNDTIRKIMQVGKNILEVTEEKRLRWFGHVKRMPGNRLPQKILEWEPEGTR
jgi:hypothetical protein